MSILKFIGQISIGAIAGTVMAIGIVGTIMFGYPVIKTRFFGEKTVDKNFTMYKSNALGAEYSITLKN
jgi:hypothetical protein